MEQECRIRAMEYVLTIDPTNCHGCRICESVCALFHEHECHPEKSRIRIIASEEEGTLITIPVTCMQCENAPCQAICPTDAIYPSPRTGARLTDPDKCIACGACVYVCPFGATYVDRAKGIAPRCDLCDGDPICVRFCPTGCLQFVKADEVSIRLKRAHLEKFLEFLKMAAVTPKGRYSHV